eukprot:320625_1
MKSRVKLNPTQYEAYRRTGIEIGLASSVIKWFWTHILLLVISIPAMLIIILVTIVFFVPTLTKRKTRCIMCHYVLLYILLILCLLAGYVLSILYPDRFFVASFYSIIPIVLSIVFKNAIVDFMRIRLYALRIWKSFKENRFCVACCIPQIIKKILLNYYIWGSSLRDYEPYYGKCLQFDNLIQLTYHEEYNEFSPIKIFSFYKNKFQLFTFILSTFLAAIMVIAPIIYTIITKSDAIADVYNIIMFVIGIVFSLWTVISISLFIEIVFYRLQEYYNYMHNLSEIIQINPNIDPHISKSFSIPSTNQNSFQVLKDNQDEENSCLQQWCLNFASCCLRKTEENYSTSINVALEMDSMIETNVDLYENLLQDRDEKKVSEFVEYDILPGKKSGVTQEVRKILHDPSLTEFYGAFHKAQGTKNTNKLWLHEKGNWSVWYENWCRIERLSSIYFENRRGVIFGLVVLAFVALCTLLFYYFGSEEGLNTVCITSLFGLLYFLVIICRFLQWSLKLSGLERQQIECIENQQISIKHKIILLIQEESKLDKQIDSIEPFRTKASIEEAKQTISKDEEMKPLKKYSVTKISDGEFKLNNNINSDNDMYNDMPLKKNQEYLVIGDDGQIEFNQKQKVNNEKKHDILNDLFQVDMETQKTNKQKKKDSSKQ